MANSKHGTCNIPESHFDFDQPFFQIPLYGIDHVDLYQELKCQMFKIYQHIKSNVLQYMRVNSNHP